MIFTTPNLADTKQPLLLVQGQEVRLDQDLQVPYREMVQRVAADPIGQAIVFELMIRLFFIHVLGIRAELVGWKRGERSATSGRQNRDGVAADASAPRLLGSVAMAFGPIEAQGRGSLHPHVLVWLLQVCHQEVLDLLLRDQETFQPRLRAWMSQVISTITASTATSTTTCFPFWASILTCN